MFVDRAKITIVSGKGGNGAVSFRREPFVPEGGPDGGDGGKGGDVIIQADSGLRTLMDFKYKKKYTAENGQDGMKKKRFGKAGQDLVIRVPQGTVVIDQESGLIMKDLTEPGESFVAAKGGKGGKGNVHYKNSIRQAPNFAEAGDPGKERVILLELKMIADVGLVGFPNVGKSSLLAAATHTSPKIGNYHFTTLTPNLGVVKFPQTSFVMADVAGIIEGAHEGLGLGLEFLKHIERTKVLIHVVDVSGSEGRDPIDDFEKIMKELEEYGHGIMKKPMLVAANKIDLLGGEDSEEYLKFKEAVEKQGYPVYPLSAPIHYGLKELMQAALNKVNEVNANPPETDDREYFDFEKDDHDPDYRVVKVRKDGDVYVAEGKQLTKIFNSTNFNDFGSLRYLYKYVENSGAIRKMKEMGLEEGDTIRVEDYEFEYEDEFQE
jgi:GTP-binding protein